MTAPDGPDGDRPRIGLVLPSREVVLWAGGDAQVLVDAAVEAERVGFDSVWTGESLLARPRPDALTTLAAVAAVTERVELGTAVLLPLLRHPVALAHTLATLDRLAGGRLIVGMAPGAEVAGTRTELAAVGAPADRRVARLDELLTTLRRLWSDGDDQVRIRPEPATRAGPRLWLAAHGPRMLRLTGERSDGWLPFSPTPDAFRDGLATVRSHARNAGRDADAVGAAAYLTVAVDDDPARAHRALDRYLWAYYGRSAEDMAQVQACHAGTVDTAAAWVASYVEAGARHVLLRVAAPEATGDLAAARAVLERVRSGATGR